MEGLRQVLSDAGVKPNAVAFTLLGREYSVLSTIRLVVCLCGYLVLRRAFLIYARKTHMRQLEEEAKSQAEEEEEEVTADKDKPIQLDFESGGGWGSKARSRQRWAIQRAEREIERRILEEENEGIDKYLD